MALLSGFVFQGIGGGDEHNGITFGFSATLAWNEEADLFEYRVFEEYRYHERGKSETTNHFLLWEDITLGLLGGATLNLAANVHFYFRLEECLAQLNKDKAK